MPEYKEGREVGFSKLTEDEHKGKIRRKGASETKGKEGRSEGTDRV